MTERPVALLNPSSRISNAVIESMEGHRAELAVLSIALSDMLDLRNLAQLFMLATTGAIRIASIRRAPRRR